MTLAGFWLVLVLGNVALPISHFDTLQKCEVAAQMTAKWMQTDGKTEGSALCIPRYI